METELIVSQTREFARQLRIDVLDMIHSARASHIGSCYSAADIVAVLYDQILNIRPELPEWAERDRYIHSKGHASAVLYAALARRNFFPIEDLEHFCRDGARLGGHVTRHGVPGVEFSTGSLGHGLPVGAGLALSGQRRGMSRRVFVLMSDGEQDEGSTWEAALFAGHHRLESLVAIVDYNKIQSFGRTRDVLDLEPLAAKWRAFGWDTVEVDGHDHYELLRELVRDPASGKPRCVIAHTVKGNGVSFMEDRLIWHYRPTTAEEYAAARIELGAV